MNFSYRFALIFIFSSIPVALLQAQQLEQKAMTPADSILFRDSIVYNPLLIIPFNPKYYLSEADREIAAGSKLNFEDLRERFRNGIITKLNYRISDLEHTLPLVTYADTLLDLRKIYVSTALRYEALPRPPKKSKDAKDNFAGSANTVTKTTLKKGQLESKEEPGENFMNLVILNKELLPYLAKSYGSSQYVFINQFEIKNDLSDYVAVSNGTYKRQLRVHYSIVDHSGKVVYAGLAINEFPAAENNVDEILNTYIRPICDEIVLHIPPLRKPLKTATIPFGK
jgi:hypothetical protein